MFDTISKLDKRAFQYCFTLSEQNKWSFIARKISKTGDGPMYLILSLGLLIGQARGAELFNLVLSAFILELPLYLLLKNAIRRTRPCHSLDYCMDDVTAGMEQGASLLVATTSQGSQRFEPSDKFSLPSGHTAAAFLMATAISVIYPQWLILAYSWAVAIGLSRIALGVHFPLDILAGAALGSGSVAFILFVGGL